MFNTLEKIRQKPERTKKRIALITSLVLVAVIVAVWFTVIYPDLKEENAQEEKLKNLEKSPTASFIETFSNGFSAIGSEFGKLKDRISSFTTSSVYYSATTSTEIVNSTSTEDDKI